MEKGLELDPSTPNHSELFLKIQPMTLSISWPSLMSK